MSMLRSPDATVQNADQQVGTAMTSEEVLSLMQER